jgi:hypothetical protein
VLLISPKFWPVERERKQDGSSAPRSGAVLVSAVQLLVGPEHAENSAGLRSAPWCSGHQRQGAPDIFFAGLQNVLIPR